MQLQADHFNGMRAGGGGSSSCSPPKDITVTLDTKHAKNLLAKHHHHHQHHHHPHPTAQAARPEPIDVNDKPTTTPSTTTTTTTTTTIISAVPSIATATATTTATPSTTSTVTTITAATVATSPELDPTDSLAVAAVTVSSALKQPTQLVRPILSAANIPALPTVAPQSQPLELQLADSQFSGPPMSACAAPQVPGCGSGGPFDLLPSELVFHILSRLDPVDLYRLALVNKYYSNMANDPTIWRVKCMEHPLFAPRHALGPTALDWQRHYIHLDQCARQTKQNWIDAIPQSIHVLEGHTGLISSLELKLWTLVTASIDGTLRIWDLRTLNCIQVLQHKHSLTCVSQCPSLGVACARTSFGAFTIWDVKTGDIIIHDDFAMLQIASYIFMDEQYVGYGQCDGTVTMFDWSSRTELKFVCSYKEHEGDIIHMNVRNHKYVVSTSTNGETLVYSIKDSAIIGRVLLPHASQAIHFTPTIHGDKVMFSTKDAIYEYDLDLRNLRFDVDFASPSNLNSDIGLDDDASALMNVDEDPTLHDTVEFTGSRFTLSQPFDASHSSFPSNESDDLQDNNHTRAEEGSTPHSSQAQQSSLPTSMSTTALDSAKQSVPPSRLQVAPNVVWKISNSLYSQIRHKLGGNYTSHTTDIPTKFPRRVGLYCLPQDGRMLELGTTSARDSIGMFLPEDCSQLNEILVYTRDGVHPKSLHGPVIEAGLLDVARNRFYTTLECNQYFGVITAGDKIYVISFIPLEC